MQGRNEAAGVSVSDAAGGLLRHAAAAVLADETSVVREEKKARLNGILLVLKYIDWIHRGA